MLGDGENSIAVYSIHQETGEPTLIQNANTHGVHPRTFTIDPSGRILVVANMQQVLVRNGKEVRPMPTNEMSKGHENVEEICPERDRDERRSRLCDLGTSPAFRCDSLLY